ncbi:MAG: hypothetical protein KDD82_21825, partial [Planctomycetes bacterium]|nr:hypothetical protein [Planctomycetota bacterium]
MNDHDTEATPTDVASVATAAGYVVAYDPDQLRHKIKEPRSWYEGDPLGTSERRAGRYAVWPLGKLRGTHSFRLRFGALTEREQEYDQGTTDPAPLEVLGQQVFVGPLERLPGDGFGERLSRIEDGGDLYSVAPGRYAIQVHVLDWRPDDRFWTEENEPTADAPPDFVVTLEPVEELPPAPSEVAALLSLLPRKQPTASKDVVSGKTWRSRHRAPVVDPAPKKSRSRSGGSTTKRTGARRGGVVKVQPLAPGQLGVGARVKHPYHGEGEVLFVKEGFPKAKVRFHDTEIKVDKSQLTVL